MSYALEARIAARAPASERAAFIRRTYGHLAGAVLAFAILETLLLRISGIEQLVFRMAGSGLSWLVVIGAFVVVSYVARIWARSPASRNTQYAGLALYVIAEAIIFLPLLYLAKYKYPDAIPVAGMLTLGVFAGLTAVVFLTKSDFSYLWPILSIGCMISVAVIVAAIIFDFSLGLVFCYAMVALVCGFILYDTSMVLHHFRTDQHVAASLELFASIALLFWYILQIVISSNRD